MAYGQTGTGKTYTIGWQSNGLIQKASHQIFDHISCDEMNEYSVSISYLQIYNEQVHMLYKLCHGHIHLYSYHLLNTMVIALIHCSQLLDKVLLFLLSQLHH